MNYTGIDLHKKFSQFTVVNEEGEILDRKRVDNQEGTIISRLNETNETV